MRQPRLKIPSSEGPAQYHTMSRAVNREFYFRKAADKEVFCQMMWRVADFCGIQVLTFVVMSNHFHLELHVPMLGPVSDEELLRRYEVLHPKPTWRNPARLEAIWEMLRENGPEAEAWRKRQLRQMGDLSQFMKLLKQRYSIRYNRTHGRCGTLWSERYKSVMMAGQSREQASLCTALYIDLNPVRAGIVKDPAEYRFCGYGAAVGGDERARKGIIILTDSATWAEAQAKYRQMLFAVGAELGKGRTISEKDLQRTLQTKGTLPIAAVSRCRTRYLTNTLVLGGQIFVERHLADYRRRTGARMREGPRPLPGYADWGGLFALRSPRHGL
jgi:REP element-mobilizing transposase RayT